MKRAVLALIALLFIAPASAQMNLLTGAGGKFKASGVSSMVTPLLAMASPSATFSTSVVNYGAGQASINSSWASTLGSRSQPMPVTGVFDQLYVSMPTATGAGATYDVHLMVNGSASALTCQITNSSTTCNDTSHSVAVSVADTIEWRITPTNTPASQTAAQISARFTSSAAGEGFNLSLSAGNVSNSATNYFSFGNPRIPDATEITVSSVVSTAGTIDKLYVISSSAPGAAKSYTITLYKNGSASALTCQISGAATTTCNDISHSVSVTAGDLISLETVPSGTPVGSTIRVGTRWLPTVAGEVVAFSNSVGTPSTNSTRVGNLSGGNANNSTEALTYNIAPSSFTIKNLYVVQDVAPGGGQTRTITVRKGTGSGQSNTAVTCTVATAATSCSDTSNTASASVGDYLNLQTTVSGANAALAYFKTGITLSTP